MAIEVLSPAVIDRRDPWVGVAGGQLDVSQGHTGVEGSHDESSTEHVGVNDPEPGLIPSLAFLPMALTQR
jgi:hypothetical protein